MIKMSKVVVLGANYCPFCRKVNKYLESNKIPFEDIDTQTAKGKEQRQVLSKKHNYNTIPMVFVDDKFIGGCSEFFEAINNGKVKLTA